MGTFQNGVSGVEKTELGFGSAAQGRIRGRVAHLHSERISREEQLMDKLLMAGLIEARSCERFKLLSEEIADENLREFYRRLMIAEAAHYTLFLNLARTYNDKETVRERWSGMVGV